jgi:hypothetical protein
MLFWPLWAKDWADSDHMTGAKHLCFVAESRSGVGFLHQDGQVAFALLPIILTRGMAFSGNSFDAFLRSGKTSRRRENPPGFVGSAQPS